MSKKQEKAISEHIRKFGSGSVAKVKKNDFISMSISQDVNVKKKEVAIVAFFDGSNALIVDGILYHMEIMLYNSENDLEVSMSDLDMEITDYSNGLIEPIE